MRSRTLAVVICCTTLFSATALSVKGQQEPLPPVKPKTAGEPRVILAPPSLADAAAKNDYVSFAALYNDMKQHGQSVDAYAPLYDLWTWSLSNPTGAFYGNDTYERLARAYNGFAGYIAPYAIIDSAGNTFWPTSETRDFLLARAIEGDASSVVIAAETPSESTASAPVQARVSRNGIRRTKPISAPRVVAPAAVVPQPKPVAAAKTGTPPPPPIETVAETATVEVPAAVPVAALQKKPWTNGVFMLLLLAVLGVGLFAILMRNPNENTLTARIIATEKLPAPVEPIRKVSGPIDTRASGSPGSGEPQQHSPSAPDRSHRDGDVLGLRR